MILKIINGIFAFLIFCVVYTLLLNVSNYFKKKTQEIQSRIEGNTSTVIEQLDFSLSIMELIDRLIMIEIEKLIASLSLINTKFKVENTDVYIKEISDKVYKAIQPAVFNSPDMLLTSEYLMNSIIERTTHLLIANMKDYNQNFSLMFPDPKE